MEIIINMVKIGGLQKISTIDYPDKLSCVIFLSGCNYRCPDCHNPQLIENGSEAISEENLLNRMEESGYLDAVVISGGEPTLQPGLEELIKKIKKGRNNFLIKLDTNGSHYEVLQDLKKEKLVDYVAMDVKSPPYLYSTVTGKQITDLRDDVEKGMALTCQFPDYEFRTTIVPVERGNGNLGDFSFMKVSEVVDIAKWIADITGGNSSKYYLQPFVHPKGGKLFDSRFEAFPETPKELLEEMRKEVSKYLPNCRIRDNRI
jgi:pyruvate formate lyase activating enzyme